MIPFGCGCRMDAPRGQESSSQFSITLYRNQRVACKVISCCAHRFSNPKTHLAGKHGRLQFIKVEGQRLVVAAGVACV